MIAFSLFVIFGPKVIFGQAVTFENCCKYLEIGFTQDWHQRFDQYFERNGNVYENEELVLEHSSTKIRRREVSFDQSISP